MVFSDPDYPRISGKRYKDFFHKKRNNLNEIEQQKPYIFSYEDPKLHANFKSLFTPAASELQVKDHAASTEPTLKESAFDFGETPSFETDHSTQYQTIFTYAEPLIPDPCLLTGWSEERKHNRGRVVGRPLSYVLLCLSTLLLVTLFPILCWICIKRLTKNERLVVIRLGKRLRTKGPGFVVTLPFCDRGHLLHLDEQTLEIGPVSGETKDKGEVEIRGSLTYRVIDPDCTYVSTTDSPRKLLTSVAPNAIISSLKHIPWSQLEQIGGQLDLACEVVSSLNCHCGTHGLQIAKMDSVAVVLTRAPPSPETLKRSTLSAVQKQLQGLTSLFFPGQRSKSCVAKESSDSPNAAANDTATESNSSTSDKAPKTRSQSMFVSTGATNEAVVVGDLSDETVSRTRLLSLRLTDASATRAIVCSQVIARAQPFLNKDLVCAALNRTSLQLVIGSERLSEPLPELNEAAADQNHFSLLYLDAKTGRAAMGTLAIPEVILYVTAEDLSEIIAGHLDLMKALDDGKVVVKGNLKALDKLRHLLYLRST